MLYGGAAGGGKTDLALGLAATRHRTSIIFRRHYTEMVEIIDRSKAIIGDQGTFGGRVWHLQDGRRVEFGGVKQPGEEKKFMGRAHDLKAFDELANFTENQFRFLCGWLRTTYKGQRCRVVATSNPPMTDEGQWIIEYWRPWLDPVHPNPAKPGELRWFARLDDKDVEVDGPEPIPHKGEIIHPKSRTFIPARVSDNPALAGSDYEATLQAMPEPLRSQLLYGDFAAGVEDDPWQVIPSAWVVAANERWEESGGKPPYNDDDKPKPLPMTAMGVDVARGGRNQTILSPRHGPWFAEQIVYPGKDTPDGPTVAAQVIANLQDGAVVNIDVLGVGGSPRDSLVAAEQRVTELVSSAGTKARDRSKKFGFINKRAEWWWKLREALDPEHGDDLAIPPDRELLGDLCTPKWKLSARGVQVESKPDIIARLGRSPDKGDALVYAHAEIAATYAKPYGATQESYWHRPG